MTDMRLQYQRHGLYDPSQEHDACGIGFVVNVDGHKSHTIIEEGLTILCNLEHRGAVGGDRKTGDGAGMLLQIPHAFFQETNEFALPDPGSYGVGFLFLPPSASNQAREMAEQILYAEGARLLGWRSVPHVPSVLGESAVKSLPDLWQLFLAYDGISGDILERKLYVLRKCLENRARELGWNRSDFYIPSLSSRTIVYKGMFVSGQFAAFYPDLTQEIFTSALAMVHQRYSTNTFPSWSLAQPFRFIGHNGEINTIRGNINKLRDRNAALSSPLFGKDIEKLFPILDPSASDSACFDNVFELLTMGGRSMEHTMMMMVPEAFGLKYHISRDKRAFYEYHMTIMDPWDGPAALLFSDGIKIGAYLDRNGLRPGRYVITRQGKVVLASETGVLPIDPRDVKEKGRLAPGKMFVVDTERRRVVKDNEIKAHVSRWKPYRRWLEENKIELKGLLQVPGQAGSENARLPQLKMAFGYTQEDLNMIILPMVLNAQEPVGSMGNDAKLAAFSDQPQLLYTYFRQRFAQVTNPPIDPYRENLVMSLSSWVGRQHNIMDESPIHCRQLKLSHPILTDDDIERLKQADLQFLKVVKVPMLFASHSEALEQGIHRLCLEVESKVDAGNSVIIMSDRELDQEHAAIPALLATSAVHHHLVRRAKRHLTALILETGECREIHHFATLLSFGASGVNPYLVFEIIRNMRDKGYIPVKQSLTDATLNYITAVNKGLLKIMSKMGISTMRSYRHAQTFEALGLDRNFVDQYFPGTHTQIGGAGMDVIELETLLRHRRAFQPADRSADSGKYHYRHEGEDHLLSPEAIVSLQEAVRNNDYAAYKKYSDCINTKSKQLGTLRGLFRFKPGSAISLDRVEPEEQIIKRFVTAAMSFGSISKEAHETLAIAMNRLGARSNSGEGGEDPERYTVLNNGDNLNSKIKQVASARFGVNSMYLINSEELQIKMSQGAKPGEGGQLPGFKVDKMIARVRHAIPGVMLISPPPHHDIYSIEDLAQLIFDLKCGNPQARISVKLVSEAGVGTVAAGVAKAKADTVVISGHDGGTGASPLSSIKYAGSCWETGLAETQQILEMNGLRNLIRVQVDGQLRTARDIIIAAMLGAEEFGFGTIALISMGCIMMRKCHLNTCPVGIATQDPVLRERFTGKPEHVINFMRFLAREIRELMAELGFTRMNDLIGRRDYLETDTAIEHFKSRHLDLTRIFFMPDQPDGIKHYCTTGQRQDRSSSLDKNLIRSARRTLEGGQPVTLRRRIRNNHRSTGASLSAELSKLFGINGLPEDHITVKFQGSAGQSFGAFLAPGITFQLEGDANDYVGKGLSGGKIILKPPKGSQFLPQNNIIAGNVCLFGATGGEVYFNGMVGERFCVRNSGAIAVVEGVGDHGCEYMTGGRVIILGKTGVNFAAGMSGGIAYILDTTQLFDTNCNLDMVDIEVVHEPDDIVFLNNYIVRHHRYTGSPLARQVLDSWEDMLPFFVKVLPVDYRKALERITSQTSGDEDSVTMTEEVFT